MQAQELQTISVAQLRQLAKMNGIKLPAGIKKAGIIERLSALDAIRTDNSSQNASGNAAHQHISAQVIPQNENAVRRSAEPPAQKQEENSGEKENNASARSQANGNITLRTNHETSVRQYQPNISPRTIPPIMKNVYQRSETTSGAGILEIQPDGYGLLRGDNCLPGPTDIYLSTTQIRRFALRNGDYIEGKSREAREGDRYPAILYIDKINGFLPDGIRRRKRFEDLIPIHPEQRITLESPDIKNDAALRLIDFISPIGRGQRGLIVSPPKAGKTMLLKNIANAITRNHPDIELFILLIDERPEEVTEMKRSTQATVIHSTFDELPEDHAKISEMVLARAQRLVESGRDVVILLDSITRLARAYNLVIPPTGRTLSGGLDPGALHKPKKFFGAARNIEHGGSLTIIATALIETGSRMDDIIYEEFKGTGNMELHLDRKLSERRIFPAIDLQRSGTRREELLLSPEELDGVYKARRVLLGNRSQDAIEQLLSILVKTENNATFFKRLNEWISIWEKEGYTLGGR